MGRGLAATVFGGEFAALGWLAGHTLTYRIVDPPEHGHAAEHMHDYLPAVGSAGMVLLALAVLVQTLLLIRGWNPLRQWLDQPTGRALKSQAGFAAAIPALAYVGAEILERVVPGVYWFPGWKLILVGVPIQLAIGAVLYLLARLVARGIRTLVALLLGSLSTAREAVARFTSVEQVLDGVTVARERNRGPPDASVLGIMYS